jgi:hypothetical protein
MARDQDRRDDGEGRDGPSQSHVPRVDWIHNTDLDRILVGEPEPEF